MSFNTQAVIAHDPAILRRVSACAASLGIGLGGDDHPVAWANNNAWMLAVSPGWSEAFAASVAEDPGADEDAITDAMILTAVEALIAAAKHPSPTE